MTTIIGFISQKGGVGKSTLCRALACEASKSNLSVQIADLDTQQSTTLKWHERRKASTIRPIFDVTECPTINKALSLAGKHDLLILDAPARASEATEKIAHVADLVVQPSGTGLDDLEPAVLVFHELVHKKGIAPNKLVIALSRAGTLAEIADARAYIHNAGYEVLEGALLEKPAYRQAQSMGFAVTETRYPTLNKQASKAIKKLVDKVTSLIQ